MSSPTRTVAQREERKVTPAEIFREGIPSRVRPALDLSGDHKYSRGVQARRMRSRIVGMCLQCPSMAATIRVARALGCRSSPFRPVSSFSNPPGNLVHVDDETNPEERFPSTSVTPENAPPSSSVVLHSPAAHPLAELRTPVPRKYPTTSGWIPDAHRRTHSRGCGAYTAGNTGSRFAPAVWP